jgi:gliding motility-associated-like protein
MITFIKNGPRFLLGFILFFLPLLMSAQGIKRQVICSAGKTLVGTAVKVPSTIGQCPGCGTIGGGDNVNIRQGFQQPFSNDPACAVIDFEVEAASSTICGDLFNFVFTGLANSDAVLSWDFGPNSYIPSSSALEVLELGFMTAGPQTITLTIEQNGCSAAASKIINVINPAFGAVLGITDISCFGSSTGAVTTTIFNGQVPISYGWSTGDVTSGLSDLEAGVYSMTITDGNDCQSVQSFEVAEPDSALVMSALIAEESCSQTLDGGIIVTVTGGTGSYVYAWSNGGSSTDTINQLTAGSYQVTVTDQGGCSISQIFEILVFCDHYEDALFNTFSPGSDGVNDFFTIPYADNFPNNELIVFNRWGQPIWSQKPFSNTPGWGGVDNKGNDVESGAYYFIFKLNDPEKNIFKGSITIIR